jgi:SAM-dependent methyltransferase
MFADHYVEWRKTRMQCIHKYFNTNFFKSKTLLELGCGYADLGNAFYELGASVTSSDARSEHIDIVKKKYPHIETALIDCDNDTIEKKYDIILHWGLLYHLTNVKKHLENVLQQCDILLLETEVCDSFSAEDSVCVDEEGYDQSINKKGIRPSQYYIEKILEENAFKFKLIKDSILNSGFHHYDWEITDSKTFNSGLRRFWICWKNECPIITKLHS